MTSEELDRLLDGAPGARLVLSSPDGRQLQVFFDRHALASPPAFRAAMRRALGHTGYEPPVYEVEDHDRLVRGLFVFADLVEAENSAVNMETAP